jgi:tripeptide aminopeptidase
MNKTAERFLKYVRIDTQSDESVETNPSTLKQFNLANILSEELINLGLSNVSVDENCYVMAEIPANTNKKIPTIGFIAHLDTATDMSGANVKPKIIKNYEGNDILLNEEENIILSPKDFPELIDYIGNDLIVTDGTTLLGADDKAGIAEIISAAEFFIENPDIKHGTIKIAFTPDEEVGRGTLNFDLKKFGADFAYTVDGGKIGELEYETFNASQAKIKIKGRNIHPGDAKNKMINAQRIGFELDLLLPQEQKPEYTEGYEGFFHLLECSGDVEEFNMRYIIRDHDIEKFQSKKALIEKAIDFINNKYGDNTAKLNLKDQYFNMKEKILPYYHIVETAKKVMESIGIAPIIKPIRGGTDGAALSLKGLPTPNLFTGGHNFHGKYEFIPVQSMEKTVKVIIGIIRDYASKQE